jgi:CRP/FNR family transcriptional regulator, cyclic AMP receptor protein
MFRKNPKVGELERVQLFAACTRRELEEIGLLADEVSVPAGTKLTREGTAGRECFVIADGEAVVRIKGRDVAHVGPGDIVGEMSLLDREPRSATVIATQPLRVFVLTAVQFAKVADRCPSVARRVMQILAHRLREAQAA